MLLALLLSSAPPVPVEVQRPHPERPVLALEWSTADDECPSRAELLERIAEQGVDGQLGEWVPARHAKAGLAVEVEITGAADRWHATVQLADADGRSQRSFTASSCAALADATALIVAVTLDPVAVATARRSSTNAPAPEPAREPEPKPEPPPAPEPPPRDADAPATDDRPLTLSVSPRADADDPIRWPADLRLGLSVHGGGGTGPTQSGYAAVGGRLALFGPRWRAEVGGRWSIPRRFEANNAAGSFDMWVVEGRGCFVPKAADVVEFPLCPGIELGSVRGRGLSPTSSPSERSFLWIAPSLSQGLTWAPVERFAIGIELGLVVPLTRGSFVVGPTELARLATVGAQGLLSLELRLF